jgi:predicted Zn-dependent protease
MNKFLKIFLPLFVIGTVVFQFRSTLLARLSPILNNISSFFIKHDPCTEPIPYALGTFDTQFNISQKYFLNALTDAEAIWEKPFGKDLFTYAPQDSTYNVLKINLIYDYRQQATSKLASLGIVVEENKASYDMLKAKFTTLKAKYDAEKNIFNALIEDFNQKQQVYEDEVKLWNKKGGAPIKEFNKIEANRLALEAELKELQAMQIRINEMADELDALVVVINRLITSLNLSVEKYNTTNTSRGESFEEGVFSTDGLKREIDIYEFSSREKLVRVLAHELGHALGVGHVDDPKAIMYMFNQGNNEILMKSDLTALKTICGVEE